MRGFGKLNEEDNAEKKGKSWRQRLPEKQEPVLRFKYGSSTGVQRSESRMDQRIVSNPFLATKDKIRPGMRGE